MIRNLFNKHDHRPMSGVTKEQAIQAAAWFWRSRLFGVDFSSPFSLRGIQFHSKLGLRQSVSVYAVDEGGQTGVDLTFSAELTDEGAVAGAVGAVLILPVAAVVGAVSYVEYENDAQRLMNEFWSYLYAFPKDPVPPTGPVPPPTSGEAVSSSNASGSADKARGVCPGCGASHDDDSKFCKYCGKRL